MTEPVKLSGRTICFSPPGPHYVLSVFNVVLGGPGG